MIAAVMPAFGGQSAPPSLKLVLIATAGIAARFRGAVRPPFIEAAHVTEGDVAALGLSGGSPPPLH